VVRPNGNRNRPDGCVARVAGVVDTDWLFRSVNKAPQDASYADAAAANLALIYNVILRALPPLERAT
jgi:hypothetical protein